MCTMRLEELPALGHGWGGFLEGCAGIVFLVRVLPVLWWGPGNAWIAVLRGRIVVVLVLLLELLLLQHVLLLLQPRGAERRLHAGAVGAAVVGDDAAVGALGEVLLGMAGGGVGDGGSVGGEGGGGHGALVVAFFVEFDFFQESVDEDFVRVLEVLLDEAGEEHVAAHVDFFSQVEAVSRCVHSQFSCLSRLSGHVSSHGPFGLDV